MLQAKPGEILRHKQTRHPYIVIDKSSAGITVVDLFGKIDPAPAVVILNRVMDKFEPDVEMIDMTETEAVKLKKALPLVEAVQESLLKDNG